MHQLSFIPGLAHLSFFILKSQCSAVILEPFYKPYIQETKGRFYSQTLQIGPTVSYLHSSLLHRAPHAHGPSSCTYTGGIFLCSVLPRPQHTNPLHAYAVVSRFPARQGPVVMLLPPLQDLLESNCVVYACRNDWQLCAVVDWTGTIRNSFLLPVSDRPGRPEGTRRTWACRFCFLFYFLNAPPRPPWLSVLALIKLTRCGLRPGRRAVGGGGGERCAFPLLKTLLLEVLHWCDKEGILRLFNFFFLAYFSVFCFFNEG